MSNTFWDRSERKRTKEGRKGDRPAYGRVKAPLAFAAGGWGQIEHGSWKSTDETDFQQMRQLVHAAIEPLPYHDIAGTCGRDEDCQCLSCWVRKAKEERKRYAGPVR